MVLQSVGKEKNNKKPHDLTLKEERENYLKFSGPHNYLKSILNTSIWPSKIQTCPYQCEPYTLITRLSVQSLYYAHYNIYKHIYATLNIILKFKINKTITYII